MSIELKNELVVLEQKRKEAADQILMLEKQIEEAEQKRKAEASAVKKPQYITENESKSAFELIFNCPDIESLNYILAHMNCDGFNFNMLLVQIINRKDKLFLMDALVTLDKRGLISKSDMFLNESTSDSGNTIFIHRSKYFSDACAMFNDFENEFSMCLAFILILYRRNINTDDTIDMPIWLKNSFKTPMSHLDNYFMNYALGLYSKYFDHISERGRRENLQKRAVHMRYNDALSKMIASTACYSELTIDIFNFFDAMNCRENICFGWQSGGDINQYIARSRFIRIMDNLIQSNKFEEAQSFAARYEEESVKFYIFPLSHCPNIDVAVYKKWRAILPEDYFKSFNFMSQLTTGPIYSAELFRAIIEDFNFDHADVTKSDTAKMRAISTCIANRRAHYVPILLEKFAQL